MPSPPACRRQSILAGSIPVFLVAAFLLINHAAPGGRPLAGIRGIDAVGYFGIAHSLLFDRNFDLSDEYRRFPPEPGSEPLTRIQNETGLPGSPWPIGYSLLAMPFLATGTLVDWIAGHPADGYGHFAVLFYCLANVVFAGAGALLLFGFSRKTSAILSPRYSPGFRAWTALSAVVAVLFGTTAGYYAFSPLSHASTFLMSSLFLCLWWDARYSDRPAQWARLGLAGGLLSICRWQEVIFLAGPLLFDAAMWREWRKPTRTVAWLRSRLSYLVAAAVCWVPQILEWKTIYGRVLINPQGDGFVRLPPRFIAEVLLSSEHGWFIWTPLALLGVAGLLRGTRISAMHFWPWIVLTALDVSIMGSLPKHNWTGGAAFGQRSLTSLAPLLALGLTAMFYSLASWRRWVLTAFVLVCMIYTTIFAVQLRLNMISTGRLTFAELITDKLRLDRALQRRKLFLRAAEVNRGGDAAAAAAVLTEAIRNYGEDRNLLSLLAATSRALGHDSEAQSAGARLSALRSREIW